MAKRMSAAQIRQPAQQLRLIPRSLEGILVLSGRSPFTGVMLRHPGVCGASIVCALGTVHRRTGPGPLRHDCRHEVLRQLPGQ